MSLDPSHSLPPLRPFTPTLIHYPASPLSIPLVLLSLTPIFIFVSYLTLVLFTRRLTVLSLASGQLTNEACSLLCKRLLKGDRPYKGHVDVGSGYGMPSSHAQAAGYVLAWSVGYFVTRGNRYVVQDGEGGDRGLRGLRGLRWWRERIWLGGVALWSVLVSYSRWYLHYHSPSQVVAGYTLGLAFGAVFFWATEWVPMSRPTGLLGRFRSAVEAAWEGVGGVGGWQLGGASGGWGEGKYLLGERRGARSEWTDHLLAKGKKVS